MKKKLLLGICLSLLFIFLLGIGVSYSLWNISVSEDKVNTAMTSCFDITYGSETAAVNLEKQYPISDEAGSKLEPYTFKLTNNCDINAYYKINLETLNDSNIDTKFMKASLNNDNPNLISSYSETKTSLTDGKVANNLKSGYLPVGGSISFDLRIWIDYDTTVDDIKNDGTDKWGGKIVVVSSPVTEEEINKACQDKGGDLIDEGECRKYYVKLNNIVNNGIFQNNAENWNFLNSHFISYNKDTNFLNLECYTLPCGPYQGIWDKALKNNVYYVSQNVKVKNINSNFYLGLENVYRPSANIKNYDWNKFSKVIDYNDSLENIITQEKNTAFVVYIYDKGSNGFYIRNLIFTNLTLMFGKNNEPSGEWCDKYLDRYIEYNLEGILTPIKEIGDPIKTSYYDIVNLF